MVFPAYSHMSIFSWQMTVASVGCALCSFAEIVFLSVAELNVMERITFQLLNYEVFPPVNLSIEESHV